MLDFFSDSRGLKTLENKLIVENKNQIISDINNIKESYFIDDDTTVLFIEDNSTKYEYVLMKKTNSYNSDNFSNKTGLNEDFLLIDKTLIETDFVLFRLIRKTFNKIFGDGFLLQGTYTDKNNLNLVNYGSLNILNNVGEFYLDGIENFDSISFNIRYKDITYTSFKIVLGDSFDLTDLKTSINSNFINFDYEDQNMEESVINDIDEIKNFINILKGTFVKVEKTDNNMYKIMIGINITSNNDSPVPYLTIENISCKIKNNAKGYYLFYKNNNNYASSKTKTNNSFIRENIFLIPTYKVMDLNVPYNSKTIHLDNAIPIIKNGITKTLRVYLNGNLLNHGTDYTIARDSTNENYTDIILKGNVMLESSLRVVYKTVSLITI